MADITTFLQEAIFAKIILPFLLIFLIIFAVLEKTKLLGDKKQVHAMIAGVVAAIFVGALYPVLVVSNLILFLTVTIVAIFVILLLWGFVFGDSAKLMETKWLKWVMIGIIAFAFVIGLIWATGMWGRLKEFLMSGLSGTIFTNAIFVIVIAIALALVLKSKVGGDK